MTFEQWWEHNGAKYSADACHMSDYHMASLVWEAAIAAERACPGNTVSMNGQPLNYVISGPNGEAIPAYSCASMHCGGPRQDGSCGLVFSGQDISMVHCMRYAKAR